MIEERLHFYLLYFEHESKHESENEPVVEQYFGSEFVPIAHAPCKELDLLCLPACLGVKQDRKSFQTGNLLFLAMP